ncbi:hypothetical protein [Streptomyces sp. NBC_00203]
MPEVGATPEPAAGWARDLFVPASASASWLPLDDEGARDVKTRAPYGM